MGHSKLSLVIVCGGMSAEHEVSLASTKNVLDALDRSKYEIHVVVLGRDGRLLAAGSPDRMLSTARLEGDAGQRAPVLQVEVDAEGADTVAIVGTNQRAELVPLNGQWGATPIDVIFPVMHGPIGEDGAIQGLARMANVPVVGSGVLGSAVNMDKEIMKRLLRDAGLPIAGFMTHRDGVDPIPSFDRVASTLGVPFYVKPANMGSSVGVSRVTTAEEHARAVEDALAFDTKILFEEGISGRELECAVLGTDAPVASGVGEVVLGDPAAFYSYQNKYLDESGAALQIPAELDDDTANEIRRLAIEAFKATCAEGMARVDFFLADDGRILVNELNTIPGFTNISMYPTLWRASGLGTSELLDRLIEDAMQRFERRSRLRTSVR